MMHRQLAAHMDTFDSDDDFSESPSLMEEEPEDIAQVDSVAVALQAAAVRKRGRFRIKSQSARKGIGKFFFLCPIVIALGDYIGLVASLLLTSTAMLYLQMEPDRGAEVVKENIDQPSPEPSSPMPRAARRRSSLRLGQGRQGELETFNRQQYSDCRIRVTRFLGFLGAPPLRRVSMSQKQFQDPATAKPGLLGTKGQTIRITDKAARSLVLFSHAHTELLLILDQAYNWMQISSSLHLGLGPQSQCVERVERAALAKEYRESSSKSNINTMPTLKIEEEEEVTDELQQYKQQQRDLPLEPHRKSNVLALASVRKVVAQFIVDEAKSLNAILAHCESGERRPSLAMARAHYDDAAATPMSPPGRASSLGGGFQEEDLLEVPEIISLTWIKSSRHRLVVKLRQILHLMCSVSWLQRLSSEDGLLGQTQLEESMWSAREAKEYLVSNLLLNQATMNHEQRSGDGSGTISNDAIEAMPTIIEQPAGHDPLIQSLLQFREHLDAVHGALWACRHYLTPPPSRPGMGYGDDEETEYDDDDDESTEGAKKRMMADRVQWWGQVRKLSTALRVIEQNITDNFFQTTSQGTSEDGGSVLGAGSVDVSLSELLGDDDDDAGDFEHEGPPGPVRSSEAAPIVNTLVFSGQGAVSGRPRNNPKEGKGGPNSSSAASVPPRDIVAEGLLVQELQTRIETINPPEELEVSMSRSTSQKSESVTAAVAQPSLPRKDREPTTSLFLGATGSLLKDLKGSLPATSGADEDLVG